VDDLRGNEEVKITDELKCWCRHCGAELPPNHTGPCPHCGKTGKDYRAPVTAGVNIVARVSSKARHKGRGFKKFAKEILQGWFSSISPALKKGVYKERIIDKEKDEYHEVVENAETGEIIREVHEPLTQHKSLAKKPAKKENRLREEQHGN